MILLSMGKDKFSIKFVTKSKILFRLTYLIITKRDNNSKAYLNENNRIILFLQVQKKGKVLLKRALPFCRYA